MGDEVMGEVPDEGTPVNYESEEAAEAAMDAALKDIVGDVDDEPGDERPAPEGEESAAEGEEKAPEPEKGAEQPEETEQAKAEPETASASDLSDAYGAFLRDSYTKDEVDALQKMLGDEAFTERGKARLKVQKDTDALYADRSREKAVEKKEPDARSTQGEPDEEPASPPSNLRPLVSPFFEAVETGDEEKASVALGKLFEAANAPLWEENAQMGKALKFVIEQTLGQWKNGALRDLLGADPGEVMGDSRSKVMESYEEHFKSAAHQDKDGPDRVKALMKMALSEHAPEALAKAAIRQQEGSKPRLKRTPTRPRTKARTPELAKRTPEQRFDDAAWDVVSDNPLPLNEIRERYQS